MKKRRSVLILLVGLTLLAAATPAAAQKPRAERPTYSIGDKWIRSDGVYDLVRIEKDLYVFAAEGGLEIHLTKDLAIQKVVKSGWVEWELSPPPKMSWPLEVGKEAWSLGRLTSPRYSSTFSRATMTWKVEAFEEIQLPAGTFKAFRVLHTIKFWTGATALLLELKTWYAPEVRQLVRVEAPDFPSVAFSVVAIDRPDAAPLRVALEGPQDQTRLSSDRIVVAGKATAGKGVARVTISINGQEVSRQEEKGPPKKDVPFSLPIRLKEGKNVLLVTATDAAGETRQEARAIFYDKVALPAPTPLPVAPPPLQVSLSSPKDQGRVEHETIALAGLASGGKGVSRVIVALNGVEVSRQEERTPLPALAVNLPVKLREGQNTLVVTATDAAGSIQQEVRTVFYDKPAPLTIAFRYPEDRLTVTQETSVVAAVVTSSKGVAKVRVILNGVEVHQQSERSPQKSLVVTAPVSFREGANVVAISAREPDGTVRQEIRTVIYEKPKVTVALPPPPPLPAIPDRWAVIIGVGRYESPEIPKLRYTVSDAEAIYQTLIGLAGFKKEHVLLLTDKTEKKPTYRNVKWALGTFLARSAKKDDTVLIFFAGHGAPEVDQQGIERDGLAKYLVPSDAEPDDLYSTALPMDELQTIFGRIEAERVVAFLDSCYSGAAGGRTFTSKKTRASHVDDLFLERLARSKGRAIITASRPAEVAIELPEFGHGIFTYYLVQGLKGAADLNRDGIVTLQELYEYVAQQVTQKSRAVGGNQHPVMKGELEGILPLVQVKR